MPFKKKQPADLHTAQFRVRMTEAEKVVLAERADAAGLTLSRYVRDAAMGRRIVSRADLKAIAELRRLGGLLKLGMSKDPAHRDDYAELLAQIVAAIKRIDAGGDDDVSAG